jgi:DNA (cytosine-5)-methyltransferase 1
MLNLQGFPKDFKITLPYTQVRKIAGNSVTVPVIKAIAKNFIESLENKRPAIKSKQLELIEAI